MKRIIALIVLIGFFLANSSFADDEKQERIRASRVLKTLKSHIAKLPTKILIYMFYTDANSDTINPVGSMYFVMRDGNILIKKELAKRIEEDRAILKKHIKDNRSLFTGYNGPEESVGNVCDELLKIKTKKSNKSVYP